MKDLPSFEYASGKAPGGYACVVCGASDCKMWRIGGSSCVELHCCDCACKESSLSAYDVNDGGFIRDPRHGRIDQIGSYVPAVPTECGTSFFGYTSVPDAGVKWWRGLPTRASHTWVNSDKLARLERRAKDWAKDWKAFEFPYPCFKDEKTGCNIRGIVVACKCCGRKSAPVLDMADATDPIHANDCDAAKILGLDREVEK